MTAVFLKLLNMSISASWLVLAVLLLRLPLKKAPKWVSCLLWGIVALRLVMPVSVQSLFSLIPSAQVFPQDIAVSQTPAIHSGIPQINSAVNPIFTQQLLRGADPRENVLLFASGMWTAGVVLMLLYSAVTYVRLRWQVRASVKLQKGVYMCDDIASPFILGTLFPKIYVPSGMEEQQLAYVLAHENAHLKRWDHGWKPLGYLLLSVYWFNPLLWVAYILLCRDIERACDEKVIARMDIGDKKGYSEALVACSVHRRVVMACPVAFGEVGVKTRIKGILRYKKPAIWVVGVSMLACTLTAACFLTDPVPCKHAYEGQITMAPTCTEQGIQTLTCKSCQHSYTLPAQMLEHTYDAGVIAEEPTCTKTGIRVHNCTACGGEKTTPVEMVAHTAGELTVTKEPNCTQKGEAVSTCTQCQSVFVAQILDTNDVHDMKQTAVVEATCAKEGTATNTCTRCAYQETLTLKKKKHTYEVVDEGPKFTCTTGWLIYKSCTGCGYLKTEEAPSRACTWSEPDYFGNKRCMQCGKIQMGGGGRDLLDNTVGNTKPTMPEDLWPVLRWDPYPGGIGGIPNWP